MTHKAKGLRHGLAAATIGLGLAMPLVATAAGGGFGGGGGAGGRGFNIDPAQLIARVQDQVGFTDDEWSVLQPRILKVVALQAQTGSGGIGSLAGLLRGRGGRGRGGAAGGRAGALGGQDVNSLIDQIFNGGQPSLVTLKHNELQAAIDDPNTPNQTIAIKMAEYRQAMQFAKDALRQAEGQLQALLTVRQEAALIALGILD